MNEKICWNTFELNLATISFVVCRSYKNYFYLGLFYIFRVVAMQSSEHYTKRAKNILHIAYHSEYHETSFCSLNGMCVCVYTVQTQRVSDAFRCEPPLYQTDGTDVCSTKSKQRCWQFNVRLWTELFWFTITNAICSKYPSLLWVETFVLVVIANEFKCVNENPDLEPHSFKFFSKKKNVFLF